MAHARPSCLPETRLATPATDRRHFLQTTAALVVPLLAGTTLGRTTSAWQTGVQAGALETDAILSHIRRELSKVCGGMQGVEGIKGEHVRALAANLDLMTAHLVEKGHDRWLDAKLKEGLARSGRDGFAHELLAHQAEVTAATDEQEGTAGRVRLDHREMGAALDLVQRRGFVAVFRRATPSLVKLAAAFDRASHRQGTVIRTSGQKPGDDIGGSWVDAPPLTCKDLKTMIHGYAATAVILALLGQPEAAGICGLIAEALSILYDCICPGKEAV